MCKKTNKCESLKLPRFLVFVAYTTMLGVCGYTRTHGFTRTLPVPAGRVRVG